MGRIFEKRKHKMFARFDKMAKTFTRIGKEIAIAAKAGGPNPDSNPRLRAAMQNARSNAMPKDRVEAAIKRAQGKDATDFAEVVYEGYGPHGVAMMVETATDNTTRTVANLRSYFNKLGGALGNAGSVEFMFQRKGVFKIALAGKNMDELELDLIDAGADDVEVDDEEGVVTAYTEFENFLKMQRTLEEKHIETMMAELHRIPASTVGLTEEQMDEVAKLIDRIEEDEDVQHVFHNIG
jgi:YebC/PmpR family DNA-binding regulatory protein